MTLLPLSPVACGVGLMVLVVSVYSVYLYIGIQKARVVSAPLIRAAMPFRLADDTKQRHILVLGDSTAVGVGSLAEYTVAGRLSRDLDASVENYAVTGATTRDTLLQRTHAVRTQYDLVLIQIGANDVMGLRSLDAAARDLSELLTSLREVSSHVVVLTAGDIGKAPVFKRPLSWLMSERTRTLRGLFMEACRSFGAVYVDIYSAPDIISANPQRYHAADGLHLSADGYGYWYELVVRAIAVWPEVMPGGPVDKRDTSI